MFGGDFVKVAKQRLVLRADNLMGEKNESKLVFVLVTQRFEIGEKWSEGGKEEVVERIDDDKPGFSARFDGVD